MSRVFITQRELGFISDITKELINDVVGQTIRYYPVSEIKSDVHELYNEAIEKIWDNPIEIECLVSSPEQTTKINLFGPEKLSTIEVYLHFQSLVDKGINVSIGDFIGYGGVFYEITQVNKMRQIYGRAEQIDGYKLLCTQAREGQFATKRVGPTLGSFSDPDAVQKTFVQERGLSVVDDKPTGDVRAHQQSGQLDPPTDGPARVVEENDGKGSKFYDE